jgi:membrane-associated phospholipid phosphatase
MASRNLLSAVMLCVITTFGATAQLPSDMAALKGLAPLGILSKTPSGNAALGANFTITGGIQTGEIRQPTLLPFPEQQQQALKDAFITSGNFANLADGLGTTLGAAYIARAHYIDRTRFTNLSRDVADLFAYASAVQSSNSAAAKFFFANGTIDGNTPASEEAIALFKSIDGVPDLFGRAYGLRGGSIGANAYGNSRPFMTEPETKRIVGPDYLNTVADNVVYSRGPIMNLVNSPSYPSGHTSYGYTGALLLAILVPQRYQQMIARGAEYGNDRIIVGAHYAMDVLAGRTLALYDMAHLLANDPLYVGRSTQNAPTINDFRSEVKKARSSITAALEAGCGNTIDVCSREDIGRLSVPSANEAFYATTQSYNLPVVYPQNTDVHEDVGKLAPEAGYLLTTAFPSLTLEQADKILTDTEGPGGGFLDDGSAFGVYSRLNLYAAAGKVQQLLGGK